MIKVLEHLGIQKTYLNILKAIYTKSTINTLLNWKKKKPQRISMKVRNKARMSTFPTIIQCRTWNLSNKTSEGDKGKKNRKKSHIIIYRLSGSIQKDQIKTPTTDKHICQCSRIQINMQKSVAFLYSTGKHMKKEIKNAIPFSIASKISWNKYNKGSKRLV